MLTVLSVIGTRPEAIKMAPVIKELSRRWPDVRSVVCSVGQHREMLDQVLQIFDITPDFDLRVMRADQTLSELTARLFESLDPVVADVDPDWVLAQGDTTTVCVASMIAFYRRVAFGHVEAGLRTSDLRRPFPEEMNRRVADLIADVWFAPTETARLALLREGCRPDEVHVTGNTVVDALYDVAGREYDWTAGPLSEVPPDRPLVLITAHRRESFGGPFRDICHAIHDVATSPRGRRAHFVFPVHLNPNVQRPTRAILAGLRNVSLIDPIDYASLVHLMKRCRFVLTDSGGIQEEAPSLGIPVLVLRETTERPEGVASGLVRLVGTDRQRIVAEADALLDEEALTRQPAHGTSPYGDGQAAGRIVSILLNHARSAQAVNAPQRMEAYGR